MGRPPKPKSVHSEELLKCAQALLANGHLVDTTVMTQGKTFKAHGLVLVAYSCYFKAVMTSEEGSSNVFVLDNLQLTAAAFKVLLDYMYNGVLNVVDEELKHVEHAATQLQVESAMKIIEKMKTNLERIKRRQLHLEAKLERKRLRHLKRGQENPSSKSIARENLPEDEDTEDNATVPAMAEEDQLDVIAEAWKSVAMVTHPECEDGTTSESVAPDDRRDSKYTAKDVSEKEDKNVTRNSRESDHDESYEIDNTISEPLSLNINCDQTNVEDTKDVIKVKGCEESSEYSDCKKTVVPEMVAKEIIAKENRNHLTTDLSKFKNDDETPQTHNEDIELTDNDDTQPLPSTSQCSQDKTSAETLITLTKEVKVSGGTLNVTLGSSYDISRLLDSDDASSISSSESEDDNEGDAQNDPDFSASLEEDLVEEQDPDFTLERKSLRRQKGAKGLRPSLRKPPRLVRVVRKTRARKGRPRKVVANDDKSDHHGNHLSDDLQVDDDEENLEDTNDKDIDLESNDLSSDKLSIKTEPECDWETPQKRKRGRPKGAKNKVKADPVAKQPVVAVSRRRGRPPGSVKNEIAEKKAKDPDKPKQQKTKLLPEESLSPMFSKELNMFQCPQCPYKTRTDKVFRLHRRRHTGYKPYPCQYCGKGFIDRKYLVPHERSHTGDRPYKCDFCPSAFYDKKHLNRHVKRHTGQRDCLCSDCGLAFYDNDTLKRHHSAVHLNIRPHKCDAEGCKYAAKDATALKEHRQQHSRVAEGILCDLCGKTFINMNGLRIHKISHEDARYKCDHCSFIAHYKHVLRNHCLRLHGVDLQGTPAIKKVKCEECDFMCFTKQERHLHVLKKHLNERPHKCPICDFSTVDKGSLKKHLRTHTGVASFECVCGKRFAQHSGYIRHYRSHTGEKPYKCALCEKTYADKKSLNTHLYGHANAKPYVCQICGLFSAVRQEHLKKHIVKQHGEEVFEEYKKKGLCRPTLNACDVEALSANCVVLASDRDDELNQNTSMEELGVSPASSHESLQGDHNPVLLVTSTGQQVTGQPPQQILMAGPQVRLYEDNMAASHQMVVFPAGGSQSLMGGYMGHPHVMDQTLPPQGHMTHHLTTVNMAELSGLTPVSSMHQIEQSNQLTTHQMHNVSVQPAQPELQQQSQLHAVARQPHSQHTVAREHITQQQHEVVISQQPISHHPQVVTSQYYSPV